MGRRNHHPRGCGVALELVSHCPGLQGSSPELLRNNVGLGLRASIDDNYIFDVEMNRLSFRSILIPIFLHPWSVCVCYSQRIFTSPSTCLNSLSPVTSSTRRCFANAAAKQSA